MINQTIYIKLTALNMSEQPVEELQGQAVDGSLNLDGESRSRRSCSFSFMVPLGTSITTPLWALTHKFQLFTGRKVDNEEIKWRKQGVFVITDFNVSIGVNNQTISISGKDKMCKLDGTLGGKLETQYDFNYINLAKNGVVEEEQLPVYDIIKEAVHFLGGEPYHNIVIKDVDRYAIQRAIANTTLYKMVSANNPNDLRYGKIYGRERLSNYFIPLGITTNKNLTWAKVPSAATPEEIVNASIETHTTINDNGEAEVDYEAVKEELMDYKFTTHPEINSLFVKNRAIPVSESLLGDTIVKFKFKESEDGALDFDTIVDKNSIFNQITLLTYPGKELILAVGNTITGLLDKIIDGLLFNFEYFYDVDGRFIFQEKRNYFNRSWNNMMINADGTQYTIGANDTSKYVYEFNNTDLITQFSRNPMISEVRNDFAVWGERKTLTGETVSIHMRTAIDKIPTSYVSPYDIEGLDLIQIPITDMTYPPVEQLFDASSGNAIDTLDDLYKIYFKINDVWTTQWLAENDRIFLINENLWTVNDLNCLYIGIKEEGIVKQKTQLTADKWTKTEHGYEYFVEEGISGHLLIDYSFYQDHKNVFYDSNHYSQYGFKIHKRIDLEKQDYRFKIYHMAIDYFAHNEEEDFEIKLQEANPWCVDGKTGYEQYYTDIQRYFGTIFDFNTMAYIEQDPKDLIFWFDIIDAEDSALSDYSVKNIGTREHFENFGEKAQVLFYADDDISPVVLIPTKYADVDQSTWSNFTGYEKYYLTEDDENLFEISLLQTTAKDQIDNWIYQEACCNDSINLSVIGFYDLEPNTLITVNNHELNISGEFVIQRVSLPLSYDGTTSITAYRMLTRTY